ncbi:hypothetical protein ACFPJ1_23360 [Kribbella qitaiheensis]|uniref:hypothetical protein n=1 Tax=Kribbella qitaiheensis TaxID=1544730 RepID=UPI003623ECFC
MSARDLPERLIWATRGRSWGFRFLLNGGRSDPLPEYERSFADLEDEPKTWRRAAGKVALRFPDPLGRKDAAGRVIPHEFVVFGDLVDEIESVEDGLQQIWPLVAGAYARVWDAEGPPSVADLSLTTQDNSPLDAPRCADGDSGDDERADPF